MTIPDRKIIAVEFAKLSEVIRQLNSTVPNYYLVKIVQIQQNLEEMFEEFLKVSQRNVRVSVTRVPASLEKHSYGTVVPLVLVHAESDRGSWPEGIHADQLSLALRFLRMGIEVAGGVMNEIERREPNK